MYRNLKQYIKYLIVKFKNKGHLLLDSSCNVSLDSSFEGANKIYPYSRFSGSMGYGSYIGPHCEIAAHIGRYSSIAPYVRVNTAQHPCTYPYVTTSPMFFSTRKQNGYTFADRMMYGEFRDVVKIGNDCWIGENVFIVGGVSIGDGSVVLAGSVVTKDIPPYAIVGGVPARIYKYRYDQETISFLLNTQWWDNSEKWFREHWNLLNNMDEFKCYFAELGKKGQAD